MSNPNITSKYARQLCARELNGLRKDISRCRTRHGKKSAAAELYVYWTSGVRLTCQQLGYDIENVKAGKKVTL